MSYQVLARKWRPRKFAELVGQEHVVRALENALKNDRVHHAYLFTGTRGVGKTTIARIFAKSLNCEQGQSAEPCGQCAICQAIDHGRFVDLLEIDAASNTGVDDVREVIENAQYAPTQGRFKVYLVDEVHMLSTSAFNALLKTLEEPPAHVKFLLATTDPQKLPATVLSRCLKFDLKQLLPEQIAGQMRTILTAEGIDSDDAALEELAHAADGSMRDGLSLLDQAIAHGGGSLQADDVRAMLGSVDRQWLLALLQALAAGDGHRLVETCARIAAYTPNFKTLLDALAVLLHRIQLHQLIRDYQEDAPDADAVAQLAQHMQAEDVQLYYQFALAGQKELAWAPDLRTGFEMTLLRMLAFQPQTAASSAHTAPKKPHVAQDTPVAGQQSAPTVKAASSTAASADRDTDRSVPTAAPAVAPLPSTANPVTATPVPDTALANTAASSTSAAPQGTKPSAAPAVQDEPQHALPDPVTHWEQWIDRAELHGALRQMAVNARVASFHDRRLILDIPAARASMAVKPLVDELQHKLALFAGEPFRLEIRSSDTAVDTPAARAQKAQAARQRAAEESIDADPFIATMQETFDATIIADSVRPHTSED